jgi:ribosome biogenesis protein Nip4
MSNLIAIDIYKLLRFIQNAEVSLNMLIQLEMLLNFLERIKIFILWLLLMFVSSLGLLLHVFFYIIQMKNQIVMNHFDLMYSTKSSIKTGQPSDSFTSDISLIVVANSKIMFHRSTCTL